ncbi:MAG: putative DNA-binding domain-containing protein [Betaproteobacteria bacterium]|jgi:hypothetical protein|nr:putative DNA-binding domain-containing protein [Rhodocyclaceae bacterium]MCA3141378.1 putative DNA-binding domain-containing protein [Rhodocyclaceae bacterium]MCE2898515.1 putative DNA-binding domain-containing protein [Betaproteobacteria bacterium]
MAELAALQAAFAAVLRGEGVPPGLLHPRSDLERRLALYRNNSLSAARKALESAYPVIRQLVGEEFFAALARDLRRAQPPDSGDLNGYGAALAEFLAGCEPARELPYLPDVARLEWALHRAHYAAEPPPLDPAALAAVPAHVQASLRLRLHPACAMVSSAYPVARIWAVHQPEHTGPLEVRFAPGPHHALVQRPRWLAVAVPVEAGPHAFLAAAKAGLTLARCLEAALAADERFDLGAALAAWVQARVVVGFEAG